MKTGTVFLKSSTSNLKHPIGKRWAIALPL